MKIIPFLFVLAALSSANTFAGGKECLAASTPLPTVESRVDTSIREAVDFAAVGVPVDAKLAEVEALVAEESQLYIGAEGECLILHRLEDEVTEMRMRAHRYLVRAFEVEALQREIIFARLERAMLRMRRHWAAGEGTEDELATALEALKIDAWQWIDAQQPVTIRLRLQNAIFAAQEAAQSQIDVLHKQLEFFQVLYQARFESAAFVLKKHLASGNATRQDYVRLQLISQVYEKLRRQGMPYECAE